MTDHHHVVPVRISVIRVHCGAQISERLTICTGRDRPRDSCGVVKVPELVIFTNFGVCVKSIDKIIKGICRGSEAVGKNNRNFVRRVSLNTGQPRGAAQFLRLKQAEDTFLLHTGQIPVHFQQRAPVCSKGVFQPAHRDGMLQLAGNNHEARLTLLREGHDGGERTHHTAGGDAEHIIRRSRGFVRRNHADHRHTHAGQRVALLQRRQLHIRCRNDVLVQPDEVPHVRG